MPPAPLGPDDPDADAKRVAWRRWQYDTQVFRTTRHIDLAQHPELIPFELMKCAASPEYWMAIWLRVFEPRQRDTGYGYLPFIPFADQVDVMNRFRWTLKQNDENADAVWSKCRGWGASWIGCVLALWGWTFSQYWENAPPWNVLMLSRKEELVDSKQQRSLFWKIRRLMRDLPAWQIPKGWNPDVHDQKGILINPENGNEIGGESTNTKAGRGDRVTFAALDEAAAIPALLDKWATLAETTDHRWACSTESFEEGSDFYDLQHDDENEFKPWLIETEFWQNPLNDNPWLERQEKRYSSNPDAFMQEVWRKPYTGSTWVYEWASNIAYDPALKPVSGYSAFIGADPGFRDPTALIAVQEDPSGRINVLDAYQINGKEADYFAPLLRPNLFAEQDADWQDKDHLSWSPPKRDERPADASDEDVFTYDERALRFARTVHAMGKPSVIGDTYGETMVGATKDSVYSRWRKYGITVNRDRKQGEAVTPRVKQNRTFKGRQEAMNELKSRWRFADTPGARMAGNAWKNSKFKAVPDRNAQSEPKEPEHDSNSHLRTAGEYLAVYLTNRNRIAGRAMSKPTRTSLRQLENFGAMRGKPTPLRTTLRGVAD